jgi:hypothetical protein
MLFSSIFRHPIAIFLKNNNQTNLVENHFVTSVSEMTRPWGSRGMAIQYPPGLFDISSFQPSPITHGDFKSLMVITLVQSFTLSGGPS